MRRNVFDLQMFIDGPDKPPRYAFTYGRRRYDQFEIAHFQEVPLPGATDGREVCRIPLLSPNETVLDIIVESAAGSGYEKLQLTCGGAGPTPKAHTASLAEFAEDESSPDVRLRR